MDRAILFVELVQAEREVTQGLLVMARHQRAMGELSQAGEPIDEIENLFLSVQQTQPHREALRDCLAAQWADAAR